MGLDKSGEFGDRNEASDWCFVTNFVTSFDSLPAAKVRYLGRVGELRKEFSVKLVSEQALTLGQSQPIFDLLLDEIIGFGEGLSESEKADHAVFLFVTTVELPRYDPDLVRDVSERLEIDFEDEFPAKFPSRTRAIMMSASGSETKGCGYQ